MGADTRGACDVGCLASHVHLAFELQLLQIVLHIDSAPDESLHHCTFWNVAQNRLKDHLLALKLLLLEHNRLIWILLHCQALLSTALRLRPRLLLRRQRVPLLGRHNAKLVRDALYDIGLLLASETCLLVAIHLLLLALLLHIFIILLLVVSYLILLLPGHSNNGASLSLGLLSGLVPLLLQVLLKVADGRLLCGVLEDELEPLLDLLCQRKNVLGLLLREV